MLQYIVSLKENPLSVTDWVEYDLSIQFLEKHYFANSILILNLQLTFPCSPLFFIHLIANSGFPVFERGQRTCVCQF